MTALSIVAPMPAADSTPALEIDDLEAGYGRNVVLRGVSLRVAAGSTTALLGPNGAGKSTLLKTVSGLLPATSGSIRMYGEAITRSRPHLRAVAGLCHIPEGRGVFRQLSVRENLALVAAPGEESVATEMATDVFPILGRRLDQRAGTMSGGEQQMLAMSAAYVRSPRLVMVDEASLGLAPLIVDVIFQFLEQITHRGAALLMVDQFAERALALASHAYVLRRGSIVFQGPSAELLGSDLFEQYLSAEGPSID